MQLIACTAERSKTLRSLSDARLNEPTNAGLIRYAVLLSAHRRARHVRRADRAKREGIGRQTIEDSGTDKWIVNEDAL